MPKTDKRDDIARLIADRLASGTICITIRTPEGVNDGRLVDVLGYVFPNAWEPYLTEGYLVRTLSLRPFAVTRHWTLSPSGTACRIEFHEHSSAIADRSQLQPVGEAPRAYEPPVVPRYIGVHGEPPTFPLIVRRH